MCLHLNTARVCAQVSCAAYREVVRGNPHFIEFFQAVTPVSELGRMNIGSRPAKRKAAGSIDDLRAIPWIFAWTQIRFHLPVWLGIGQAFEVRKECTLLASGEMSCRDACRLLVLTTMPPMWLLFLFWQGLGRPAVYAFLKYCSPSQQAFTDRTHQKERIIRSIC